ncbi:MAG: hypothetical protein M0Q53_01450 [Prolixibacteraceae bacterium]|jgi:hypothetical protein|nr:hypothetical protein [Prolixibacteraceae bacterium]MCK9640448.1 hypothetical protein [Prolixibacteraceae bacterium]
MKKSGYIKLVLVATVFSACSSSKSDRERSVYMRSDTTAHYSRAHGMGLGYLGYYYAFRPYGLMGPGSGFARTGYYSGAINKGSNIGTNGAKSTAVRGGFGGTVRSSAS